MEDDFRLKTTFGERKPSLEDNLFWKTTFSKERPSVEDNLWWKTTFGGRRPLVEDDLQWKTTFVGSLHAAHSALRHFLDNIFIYLNFLFGSKICLNSNSIFIGPNILSNKIFWTNNFFYLEFINFVFDQIPNLLA